MQPVQPLGLFLVNRGDERIDDALHQSLGQSHHEEAHIEQGGSGVVEKRRDRRRRVWGKEHEPDPDEVPDGRQDVQGFHADHVDDDHGDYLMETGLI